jgi:acetyltransferase-like isoleucine patch superfamily enzyme
MSLVLNVKRAETPLYRHVKAVAKIILHFNLPLPRFACRALRVWHETVALSREALRRVWIACYRVPVFKAYCQHAGRNLYLELIPSISGAVTISIGDDVCISGALGIAAGHVIDNPELVIGDRAFIGHQVRFGVSRRITIGPSALIAQGCYLSDSDEHPLDADMRTKGFPPLDADIREIRIGPKAWLGRGCYILKGVTVGEGAIVAAGAVVVSDVPPYCIALGNPARVVQSLSFREQ